MSAIRIDAIPTIDIELRPHWVGQDLVGTTISLVGERCAQRFYAVTPQAIIDGLKMLGRTQAADWFELYFQYRALLNNKPAKSGVMLFAGADCAYLP